MRSIPIRTPRACPRDRTELKPFRIGDVSVDTCGRCAGVWLDEGELARIAHDDELEALARAGLSPVPSPFACPSCGQQCHPTYVEGVELDRCSACGGVWIDTQELTAARMRVLIRRAEQRGGGIAGLAHAAASAGVARREA